MLIKISIIDQTISEKLTNNQNKEILTLAWQWCWLAMPLVAGFLRWVLACCSIEKKTDHFGRFLAREIAKKDWFPAIEITAKVWRAYIPKTRTSSFLVTFRFKRITLKFITHVTLERMQGYEYAKMWIYTIYSILNQTNLISKLEKM